MMFGVYDVFEVIGAVGGSTPSINKVLTLLDAVADPIKMHIHCFGSFLFHRFFGDATGRAVVGDHRGGRMGVSQLFEGDVHWWNVFAIVEKGG